MVDSSFPSAGIQRIANPFMALADRLFQQPM